MRAMILAAGQGKRMMPLTATTPKPLLRAGGQSLIEWQICRLRNAGIQQIVINHNYLGERIEAALGDGSQLGVSLVYSPESEHLETAGGIIQALPLLSSGSSSPDSFLVANGDVWTDYPYQRLLERAKHFAWSAAPEKQRPLAHLVLVPDAPHHPQGDFYLLPSGEVVDELSDGVSQRLTYAGIALLRRDLFRGVTPGPGRLAPLLREAMREGRVTGECYSGDWRDIGTPERLAELERALRASSVST